MSTGQIIGGVVGGVVGFVATGGNPGGALKGAAYGAAIGGALDPPPGPKLDGPRIDDDSGQTSEFGSPIAHINGTIAVVGNVIWVEGGKMKIVAVETDNEGGKGGGDSGTTTSDEAFWTGAVVLADHQVDGIGRVWFGSNLVSNGLSADLDTAIASGDVFPTLSLQTDTGLLKASLNTNPTGATVRVYPGYDDQPVDPRYEADKGAGKASAWRGYTVMYVYDMPLTKDYGSSVAGMPIKVELIVNGSNTSPVLLQSATYEPVNDPLDIQPVANYLWPDESIVLTPDWSGSFTTTTSTLNKLNYGTSGPTRDRPIGVGGATGLQMDGDGMGFPQIGITDDPDFYTTGAFQGTLARIGNYVGFADNGGRFAAKNNEYIGASWASFKRGLFRWTGKSMLSATYLPLALTPLAVTFDDSLNVFSLEALTIRKYDGDLIELDSRAVVYEGGSTYITSPGETFLHWDVGLLYLISGRQARYVHVMPDDFSSDPVYIGDIGVSPHNEAGPGDLSIRTTVTVKSGILTRFVTTFTDNATSVDRWRLPMVDGSGQSLATVTRERLEQSELIEPADIDVTLLTDTVRGFKTSGLGSIRSSISVLTAGYPFDMVDAGYKLKCIPRGQSSVLTVDYDDIDAGPTGTTMGVALPSKYEMAKQLPRRVDVGFIDAARNYDKNVQPSIERLSSTAVNIESFDLALVFDVDEAAQRSNYEIDRKWLERRSFGPFFLPQTYQALEAADVITIPAPEATYELRLTEVNHLADGRVQCAGVPNDSAINIQNAVGGQGIIGDTTIAYAGKSVMHLLDIPLIRDEDNKAGFAAALSGKSAGWPGGNITRSLDSGQTWKSIQSFRSPVTSGICRDSLPPSDGFVIDRSSTLTVDLYSSAMTMSSITEDQMMTGKNYFAYGVNGRWEIGRFVNATLNADGSYTLDTFIRGAKGSELYTDDHIDGDSFIFLADADTAFIAANVSDIGVDRLYRGVTSGKNIDTASDTTFAYRGVNLKPLSPVHLKGFIDGSNNWQFSCVPRSRLSGSQWITGVNPPVGEDSEAYEWDAMNGSNVARTLTSTTPSVQYDSADQVTDFGSNQTTITYRVYKMSAIVGRGFVAEITL